MGAVSYCKLDLNSPDYFPNAELQQDSTAFAIYYSKLFSGPNEPYGGTGQLQA